MQETAKPVQNPKKNIDIQEHGAPSEGAPQTSGRRLFLQLHVFGHCPDAKPVVAALEKSGLESVLYLDVNDPRGIAVLILAEDPTVFTKAARALFSSSPFSSLQHLPEMTMIGRTYSSGREQNLEDWLLQKPRRTVLNPQWPWAVWYPLRRKSEFSLLSHEDQGKILAEHALLGRTYGAAGFATDVRLACYGLDRRDNEFVIGLIGAELYPLSRLVQDMRKTQQTARYIQAMGPFFVGHVFWQSPLR